MIIVKDTFVCKPGNASKAAKMFKEAMVGNPGLLYVLTDMTGGFHRVVMLSKCESLADYEKEMEEMMNPTEAMKKSMESMKGFQEMYTHGDREIFKVW